MLESDNPFMVCKNEKRMKSLVLPYFLWIFLFYLFYAFVGSRFRLVEMDKMGLIDLLKAFVTSKPMPHLWYVEWIILFQYEINARIFSGFLYLTGSFWGLYNVRLKEGFHKKSGKNFLRGIGANVPIRALAILFFVFFWIVHYQSVLPIRKYGCKIGMGISLWKIYPCYSASILIPVSGVCHHSFSCIGKWNCIEAIFAESV